MSKLAVVTGAGGGIGSACAQALAMSGYRVILHYNTSAASARAVARSINDADGIAGVLQADITDARSVDIFAETVLGAFGCPDVLVNNAGISEIKMFQDIEEEDWDRMMAANVKGAYLMTRAFAPEMIDRKSGSIINIASMWGEVGASCESHYAASKGALIALTKSLAKELGPSGIRVNSVSPGSIRTHMLDHFSEETLRELAEETPLGRLGTPADVAAMVAFLASDSASFITGQDIGINGGFVI